MSAFSGVWILPSGLACDLALWTSVLLCIEKYLIISAFAGIGAMFTFEVTVSPSLSPISSTNQTGKNHQVVEVRDSLTLVARTTMVTAHKLAY